MTRKEKYIAQWEAEQGDKMQEFDKDGYIEHLEDYADTIEQQLRAQLKEMQELRRMFAKALV